MPSMPEAALKSDKIKTYLKSIPCLFLHSVPGGAFGKCGVPDIIVCYKGKYIGIEAKTYEGCQSEIQKTRQFQIEQAGGIYILARCVEDVQAVIEPMRNQ